MDSQTINRRTTLAFILCLISFVVLVAETIFTSNREDFVIREYLGSVFGGILLLSAAYLVFAALRYQKELSRLRRGFAFLPILLLAVALGHDKFFIPDYDYGVVYEGNGKIHDVELNLGWTTAHFNSLQKDQKCWNMLNGRKLPDEVKISWVDEMKTQHSQAVVLKGKLPIIPRNCQILFRISSDKVEVKVADR